MNQTTSDDNKRKWKQGDWCWGDAAATAMSFVPAIAAWSSTTNSNSPSTSNIVTGSFAPSLLKREQPESVPEISATNTNSDDARRSTAAGSFLPSSRLKREQQSEPASASMPPNAALSASTLPARASTIGVATTTSSSSSNQATKTEPFNGKIAPASSPIPASSSSFPLNVASSSTSATLSNNGNDGVVPDSSVSSSLIPDLVGSAAVSSSLAATARKCNCYNANGDRTSCCCCRGWKTGDWCWLKEEKEEDLWEEQQEAVLATQGVTVREEQETNLLSDTPTPSAVCNSLRSSRQVKRKAAAAISSVVDDYGDEDSDEDYEVDSTMDCEEYYELGNNCSNFEIQGPKPKKATKRPHGNTDGKNGMQCTNC
mmetsp:Transcript_10085/g.21668  ORF Transcript_10085/g.21668 Transcript_10085/m.21668 type:complete len:371 (+) Transcript_10085:94-1206(+)